LLRIYLYYLKVDANLVTEYPEFVTVVVYPSTSSNMAQCQQTAEEFILDVFSPLVAVLCSADVETVCQKNNLSFVELIQPFCRLSTEGNRNHPACAFLGSLHHTS